MKHRSMFAAVMLTASFAASAGKFCAVTSMGVDCSHGTLASCQQFLGGIGGQCVVNPAALPPAAQPSQIPAPLPREPQALIAPAPRNSIYESFERGRRAADEDRERKARIDLLEAQTRAIESERARTSFDWEGLAKQAPAIMGKRPVYSCEGQTSEVPAIGCVVIGFSSPP